jgi:hypothetical protein
MPLRFSILALLLCGAISVADQPQLRILTEKAPLSGELVGVNAKAVIFKSDGKEIETPLAQVLSVDLATVPKDVPDKNAKYIDVELTDGTLLHCGQFALKGKEVQLTLLSGQALKFPVEHLRYYLTEAHDKTDRQKWEGYLTKKVNFDQFVVINTTKGAPGKPDERVMNAVQVTVGDADDKGENIEFTLSGENDKRTKSLSTIRGIIFKNTIIPDAAPVVCRIYDVNANLIIASAVTLEGDKVSVTTPVGVKLELTRAALAKLDYTGGKLVYLSDWDDKKIGKSETSTEGRIDHFRRDKNLDDGPIRIAGRAPFAKGLALHSHTELEFPLEGEYREFKAIVGVDEVVGGTDNPTDVTIEGDGKVLRQLSVSRKDKEPVDLTVNVQNVKKLKIVVSSPDVLDLGHHVDLAEARVSK